MNGKEMKWLLPAAVVVVLLLSIVGLALMNTPKEDGDETKKEQMTYGFSIGPIKDDKGNPVSGASVSILGEGNVIANSTTNEQGYAEFNLSEPLDWGNFQLRISADGYNEYTMNITLGYDAVNKVVVVGPADVDNIKLTHIEIPPVKLSVGPVRDAAGNAIEGAHVVLSRGGLIVRQGDTDDKGIVVFSFDTPPEDGTYTLSVVADGFVEGTFTVSIAYDEVNNALSVAGTDLSSITLASQEKQEKKDEVDYYKELPAYQEVEDADEAPADPEKELDPDGNNQPEYLNTIESESKTDPGVDQWVPVGQDNQPEYSPEIESYEPFNPEPYMDRGQTRGPQQGNLTHYNDFVNPSEILDNRTDEAVNYHTNATNTEETGKFTAMITETWEIIGDHFKAGYINGTNASDENGDNTTDHLVIWKAVYVEEDRNGDNITDYKAAGVQAIEMWDNNSNGNFEHKRSFMAVKDAYDNNTDGHFEDVKMVAAVGEEFSIDGNLTRHYKAVAVFFNHTIDENNDSIYELHQAVVYIKVMYDNNSNGNFELVREFAGGKETYNNDSDNDTEHLLLVWAGHEARDMNDDGSEDQNTSIVWIYGHEDADEDGRYEDEHLLVISNVRYDNNTNGNFETKYDLVAGFRLIDGNSDGMPEDKEAVFAVSHNWDINDDGTYDGNRSAAHVFIWQDDNNDGNPEYRRALLYYEEKFDNNTNGNTELQRNVIMAVVVEDWDSDGQPNEVLAVDYGVQAEDMNDDGSQDHNSSMARVLHFTDSDGDGNPEYKHAIFGVEEKWDNNTDGVFEAVNQFVAGYEGVDSDSDGQPDEESFFILVNHTSDANDDGNPEVIENAIMASHVEYSGNGTVAYARHVLIQAVMYDNNSNGHFENVTAILAGHEGFNGTQNSTGNMTWEEEHVLIIFYQKQDTDDDGTYDYENAAKVEF